MLDKDFMQWIKERDEAAQSFDVETFKAFHKKWQDKGMYDIPVPPDDVIEVAMRKVVCSIAHPDPKKYEEAIEWLSDRGYATHIW